MKEVSKYSTKKIIIFLVICTLLILVIIGIAFSLFNDLNKDNTDKMNMGTIYLQYVSDDNTYILENATPINDNDAKKLNEEGDYFDFSVTCQVNKEINYEIALIKDNTSTISDNSVKFYLEKQNNGTFSKVFESEKFKPLNKESKFGSPKGSMVLGQIKCNNNRTDTYRLRMWLDEKSPVVSSSQFYKVKIKIYNKID